MTLGGEEKRKKLLIIIIIIKNLFHTEERLQRKPTNEQFLIKTHG